METFNEDQFLAHFFRADDVVEVNACKLQNYMMESRKKDREMNKLKNEIQILKVLLDSKNEKIAELNRLSHLVYKLDIKG